MKMFLGKQLFLSGEWLGRPKDDLRFVCKIAIGAINKVIHSDEGAHDGCVDMQVRCDGPVQSLVQGYLFQSAYGVRLRATTR